MITVYDSADLGSIPGRVNFFKFEIFNSYDIFICSGVYIDTFGLKSSQPPWTDDLAVVVKTLYSTLKNHM
jgi:hypothetical protein